MRRAGLRLFTAVLLLGLATAAMAEPSPRIVEHYPGREF